MSEGTIKVCIKDRSVLITLEHVNGDSAEVVMDHVQAMRTAEWINHCARIAERLNAEAPPEEK